jgi:hypothetical protein
MDELKRHALQLGEIRKLADTVRSLSYMPRMTNCTTTRLFCEIFC